MPIPTPDSNIDTVVKCFQDVDHMDYGHLCIEGYTLAGYGSSAAVMCFANWDGQRCSSCAYAEKLCYDPAVPGNWKGGYRLSCSNVFPAIPSMTVCGDAISYSNRSSRASGHLIFSLIFALVAVRALVAVYCRRHHPTTRHHALNDGDDDDSDDDGGATQQHGAYRSVPVTDRHAVEDDEEHATTTTTELTSVHHLHKHAAPPMKSAAVVVV